MIVPEAGEGSAESDKYNREECGKAARESGGSKSAWAN